jgi:hypothetical protein
MGVARCLQSPESLGAWHDEWNTQVGLHSWANMGVYPYLLRYTTKTHGDTGNRSKKYQQHRLSHRFWQWSWKIMINQVILGVLYFIDLYCTFLLRPRQIEEFHSTNSDAQSMPLALNCVGAVCSIRVGSHTIQRSIPHGNVGSTNLQSRDIPDGNCCDKMFRPLGYPQIGETNMVFLKWWYTQII